MTIVRLWSEFSDFLKMGSISEVYSGCDRHHFSENNLGKVRVDLFQCGNKLLSYKHL